MLRLTSKKKKLGNFRIEVACVASISRHIMAHNYITAFHHFPALFSAQDILRSFRESVVCIILPSFVASVVLCTVIKAGSVKIK